MEAVPVAAMLTVQLDVEPGGSGPLGGPCLPTPCATTTSELNVMISGLPSLVGIQYVLDVGPDRGLQGTVQAGSWRFAHTFDRDVSGEPMQLRMLDAAGSRTLATSTADAQTQVPLQVHLVDGVVTATTEQIGAVDVSALVTITADVRVPAGLELVAWIDGTPIGIIADGVLDERIERLQLGDASRLDITLQPAGTGLPDGGTGRQADAVLVFTTAL